MKRDPDLLRQILLAVEASDDGVSRPDGLDETNAAAVAFHVDLLFEAGLLRRDILPDGSPQLRLTWHGHDYLDHVRDPAACRYARRTATRVGHWSVATIGAVARAAVLAKAQALGLPLHL